MSTYTHVPSAPLSDFVDFLWLSEHYAQPHLQERLMPSGLMNLVVTWDADGTVWSGVSGVHTKAILLSTSLPFTALGVSFKAGGGFPFLPMPAGELQDLHVPLDAVWGCRANEMCELLADARTPARRFQILEHALLAAARGSFDRHPAVRYAVRALSRVSCPRPVGQIVNDVGMSQRRFIEVFHDEVGVTPKAFARLRRFQHALGAVEHLTNVDWTSVAMSCGYFDQAHFIHDFRDFAGVSPSLYLKFRASRNHVAVHD